MEDKVASQSGKERKQDGPLEKKKIKYKRSNIQILEIPETVNKECGENRQNNKKVFQNEH